MHVSSHGNGEEILNMIREISYEKLNSIHTEHIESFNILKEDGIEVIPPEIKL